MVELAPLSGRIPRSGERARAGEELAEARLLLEHALAVQQDLAAQERHPRLAARLPALVGREAGDAEVLRPLDGPGGRLVPDAQVRVGAHADHALPRVEPEDARGILGEDARHPRHRQPAIDDALAVHQRHERLERGRAEGNRLAVRIDEDVRAPRLFRCGDARRVVARHRGDEARLGSRPERRAVRAVGGPERRADLGEGAQALHLLVGQEQVLRAGLRPHLLAFRLRALDALEAEPGAEMHHVHRAVGEPADEDGAVDRLFLRPVRAGRGEIGGRGPALGDGLVLEVAEHVAVLAVELAEAAERGEPLHGLGDELVGDHALGPLLVGHEQLERRDAHPERLRDALEDMGLVVQDEVKAEVEDGERARLLAQARRRPGQALALVVGDERQQGRQARIGRGERRRLPVVVLRTDVQVAIDEAGQDVLALGVDHAVGRGQQRLGADRGDLVALDGDGRLEDVGGGHDPAAPDDRVDARRGFALIGSPECG